MKRILVVLMAMFMCFGMSSVALADEVPTATMKRENFTNIERAIFPPVVNNEITPFATETWGKTTGYKKVGSFTMTGNNLTPVKTIGATGNLRLRLDSVQVVGATKNYKLRVQIKDYSSQKVLREWTTNGFTSIKNTVLSGYQSVAKGQKIQIYFRIYEAATNKYVDSQKVKITYSYSLQ